MAASLDANYGIATGAWVEERDNWAAALSRARREGWQTVELTAVRGTRLLELIGLLADEPSALDGFERISVHAPAADFHADPDGIVAALYAVTYPVVLHPDVYRDQRWVRELGSRAVFENMDAVKVFGQDADDLGDTFAAFPEAGFCLDVAHVWTNDPTLRLGHELLDAHGDRLRQLHVSGIEPDGTHRPTTHADLTLYEPLLARCGEVPWLLEAELVGAPT